MNETGRRTAEVNVEPYKVVRWSNQEGREFALVDMEHYKAGGEAGAVVLFGYDTEELNKKADQLNDKYEKALSTRIHDEYTIDLDEDTHIMVTKILASGRADVENHLKNHPLIQILRDTLGKDSEDYRKAEAEAFEETKKKIEQELTPNALIKELVKDAYATAIRKGKVKP